MKDLAPVFLASPVNSVLIVLSDELTEDQMQMTLAPDQHVIEAFAQQRSDQSLYERTEELHCQI